jgi:hypothetical protein
VFQGTGLVDAFCAVQKTSLVVSRPFLALGDRSTFVPKHQIKITNNGKTTLTFRPRHIPAITGYGLDKESSQWSGFANISYVRTHAMVKFDQNKITLRPGKTITLNVKIAAPRGLNTARFPVYSGFLRLESMQACESHSIQYFGLAAAFKDKPTINIGRFGPDGYLPAVWKSGTKEPIKTVDLAGAGAELAISLGSESPSLLRSARP